MLRRLFTILSALSLVLGVVSCAMWVRSYRVHDGFPSYLTHSGTIVDSWWGRIVVSRMEFSEIGRNGVARIDAAGVEYHPAGDRGSRQLYLAMRAAQSSADSLILMGPRITSPSPRPSNGFGFHTEAMRFGPGRDGSFLNIRVIAAPYWPVCGALSVAPGAWFRRRRRQRRRRLHCLCACCGYDLRASRDQCPECGTETKPGQRSPD